MILSLSRKELIRKFKALGYSGPYSGGNHQFMIKGHLKIRIPNPHRRDIGTGLLKEILRQAGISIEDWDKI
jgi:predicted RNA binding protein YcfA (HicA-like mRNA interferase family)